MITWANETLILQSCLQNLWAKSCDMIGSSDTPLHWIFFDAIRFSWSHSSHVGEVTSTISEEHWKSICIPVSLRSDGAFSCVDGAVTPCGEKISTLQVSLKRFMKCLPHSDLLGVYISFNAGVGNNGSLLLSVLEDLKAACRYCTVIRWVVESLECFMQQHYNKHLS